MSNAEEKSARKRKTTTNKKTTRKYTRKAPKPVEKSYDFTGVWSPIGGGNNGLSTTYDAFNAENIPSPGEMIGQFTGTVYACVVKIARSLARIKLRLVDGNGAKYKSHPVLDLLFKNPNLTYSSIISATSAYMDILGRAFWLITPNDLGEPGRIDVLPAHLVVTERDENGKVTGYQLGAKEHDDDEPTYRVDQVLAFRNFEYFDAAQEGISPVRSVWQKLQLSNAELSSWETIVKTMAHPSVLLSPKDPNAPMSPEAAERFVKEYQARLSRGNQGGPLLLNEALDLNVLSFPPKDTAGLQLQADLKTSILNAFDMPQPMMDMQDANIAGATCAQRSYQLECLTPRISHILETITHGLVRYWGDELKLEYEDFVEKDEQLELQRVTADRAALTAGFQVGAVQKNELRAALGLPADPAGNTYYTPPAPSMPGMQFPSNDRPDQSKSKASGPTGPPIKPLVAVLQKWFAKQAEYVLDRTKTKSWKSKSWFSLDQFTNDMARDLFPVVAVFYDAGAKAFGEKYGLNDDVFKVVNPHLKTAVQRATMRFAESTNRTTSMAIEAARQKLRDEMAEGLVEGDLYSALTDRVQAIFENATEYRSYSIAASEATRARSASEIVTAKASGVVSKKIWLADNRACPICTKLNGQQRDLDEPFFIDLSQGEYGICLHPPAHPGGCRCALTYQTTE